MSGAVHDMFSEDFEEGVTIRTPARTIMFRCRDTA